MNFIPPDKAVIDTSVLFDALLLNYYHKNKHKSDSIIKYTNNQYIDNDIFKKNYTEFLEKIAQFVTTSHAIGELQGLFSSRTKVTGDLKKIFWEYSIKYLINKNLDEKLVSLISLSTKNDIYKIGYIDIGLIALAFNQKITLITDDKNTLAAFALNKAIKVIIPKEYLKNRF